MKEETNLLTTIKAFRYIIYEGKELRTSQPRPVQDKIAVCKARYEKGKLKQNSMENIVRIFFNLKKQAQWEPKKRYQETEGDTL